MALPADSTVREHLPRVLHGSWREVERRLDGAAYRHVSDPWTVILSTELHPHPYTGKEELWLHCSTARADRLPTWPELVEVRDLFLGRNTTALQVVPSHAEYVNVHPNCLHLWVPIGRRVTPDFTRGSGSL